MSTELALPTIGELLARRGFVIDTDKLSHITVNAGRCSNPECTHGNGLVPITAVMEMALSRTYLTHDCYLLSTNRSGSYPELTTFHRFCVSVYTVHNDPSTLLDSTTFEWFEGRTVLLQPHPSGLSLEKVNEEGLRAEIRSRKEFLYQRFLDNLERDGDWVIPKLSGDTDDLVLLQLREEGGVFEAQAFCEEYFGSSCIPGVIMVPVRLVQGLSFRDSHWKFPMWDIHSQQRVSSRDEGTVWFLGRQPCFEPVWLLDSYTPEVRETAAGLMGTLSLQETLDAAVEV